MEYIDAHAHIYPDTIALKAAKAIADFYEMDMHHDGRLTPLRERAKAAGIIKCLVHGVGVTPDRVESINNYLIRTVQENQDILIGFAAMHPDVADVSAEIKRVKAAGMLGVKLHPDFQKIYVDSDGVIAIFRCLAEENMPVMLHMGDPRYAYSEPQRLVKALQAVPDVKVIAAHLGGWQVWAEAWKHLADLAHVWVDTSSSLYAFTPDESVKLLRRYRPDRVLFGTDYPMWDPAEERARFDALPLTQTERDAIGRKNMDAFLQQF